MPGKEIDQRPHLGRDVLAGRIDGVDAQLDGMKLGHQLDQRAGCEVVPDEERGLQYHPLMRMAVPSLRACAIRAMQMPRPMPPVAPVTRA